MNKLLLFVTLLVSSLASAKTITPQTIPDLYKTSVRIYDKDQRGGGTGSIFRSYKNASHILTNKHVCRLVEQGGLVSYKDKNYEVSHYKKYPQHDLCLVRIKHNLRVTTTISDTLAKISSTVYVSGHPSLLPHIATKGHLSDRMDIQLVVGTKECSDDNKSIECAWFGGQPVVKTFDSQVVSNLIKAGSSGSAVFNENGEIVGVIYAGSGGDFSHGFIVPHIYVLYFIQNAHRLKWVKVGTPVDDEGLSGRIFNYNKCKDVQTKDSKKYDKLKAFCDSIQDNVIWRKK